MKTTTKVLLIGLVVVAISALAIAIVSQTALACNPLDTTCVPSPWG